MVLEDDLLVKRDTFTNVSEINWKQMCGADSHVLNKEILTLHLSRDVDIKVIFSYVRENGNNYEVEGFFYDDGNLYHLRIWYFLDHDYASVEFTPWPDYFLRDMSEYFAEYLKSVKGE